MSKTWYETFLYEALFYEALLYKLIVVFSEDI